MKTAISLPDDTFESASQRAKDLGMSRSEFFARAAQNYIMELDSKSLTDQINAALDQIGPADESALAAVRVGHALLTHDTDEW